jgi:tetratricopeptide (TPR) repeat protein
LQLLRLWKHRHERPAQRQLFADGQKLDALRSAKRFTEAIELATNLVRQHPDKVDILRLVGWLHFEAGDTHKAEAICRELLTRPFESKAKLAELLDQLSCIALYYGRTDLLPEADAWSNEALWYAPDAITLKGTRGSILIELGRIDEGMVMLREVTKRSECKIDQTIGSAYLAKAYAAKGDFTEAQRWIEKAYAIDSEHPLVKRIAGELLPKTVA